MPEAADRLPDPGSHGGEPYTPDEIALGYGTDHDPRFPVSAAVSSAEPPEGAKERDVIRIRSNAMGKVWAKCPGCGMRWEADSQSLLLARVRGCIGLDRRTQERSSEQDGLEHCSGDIWAGLRRRQRHV